jgi:YD repeat-containing protein
VTDHTGAVTRYTYDLRGGLTKVTADYGTGNAKDTTYTLNANGAVTKQTLPSGHYNDYVYDDGGRVTSQTFKTSGGTTVDSYSYNYSPTGLPSYTTGYTRTENNGDVYTFVFDRMGRLKQEKKVDSALTTLYQQDFTYDKNGNRSTMQQQGSGAGISAFTYTYSYDAQGRMTQFTDSGRIPCLHAARLVEWPQFSPGDPYASARPCHHSRSRRLTAGMLSRVRRGADPAQAHLRGGRHQGRQ